VEYVDFTTGLPITSGNSITAEAHPKAVEAALGTYAQLAAKYANLTFPSLIQLPASPQLPADLSMLFGDFVQKYNIEAAVPTIAIFIDTVGDMFTETTAYIMSEVGAVVLNATANGGLLVPTTFNNSELYAHIAQQLGSDVLYSSTICSG
jgi:hypothetical protein